MYYIQETDKPVLIARIFNLIEIVNDRIILPIEEKETIDEKKIKILTKKIIKILDKTNCKTIILSKYLKNNEGFMEKLKSNGLNIIDGKWLFLVMSEKVIDYVVRKKELKNEETNVSILINNNFNDYILENIKEIIRKYKTVNIVTKQIEKFKKIEKQIMDEEGINITITNNKKKSLVRSNIILNVDFDTELINKYNIPEEGIIVNLQENVKITKKRFNGISINDYEIKYQNYDEYDYEKEKYYDKKDMYEAMIYKKQPYEYIKRKIDRDKVEIVKLIGNRTVL